jgi:redox-sensitive bicupin YhaK (pirin superfamily)
MIALPARDADIAPGFHVRRLLPARARRTIGAWCFLDQYGPVTFAMDVTQHPHIGLQTVTWLFDGSIVHRDSLGSEQRITPGQLNLMTSGNGIAHAELSVDLPPQRIHGVQLWVALPDESRNVDPWFAHYADLPVARLGDAEVTVFMGSLAKTHSAALKYTPLLGAEIRFVDDGVCELPLDPAHEYGLTLISGFASAEDISLETNVLYDAGAGRDTLIVIGKRDTRLLLLGGEPLREQLVMWWNFVARTSDEIEAARAQWERGERFAPVSGGGARVPAPPYAVRVRAR